MSGPVAYAAVWQPGDRAQWWRSGMSFDELVAQDSTYLGQGLRLTSLAVREGSFATVWRSGGGEQRWHAGITFDQLVALDADYLGRGLRLTAVTVENGSFGAVWHPGVGEQRWHAGIAFDQLVALDADYLNHGLRLTILEIETGSYTAVWRPGAGEQRWHAGISITEFGALDATYMARGLRIHALAIENGRYAAAWRPGTGTQWWSARRSLVDFCTDDAAHFQSGLRLAFIILHDDPIGAYRYPWDSGVSHTVTHGNSNGGGSHTGNQAFAYDFGLTAGTTVCAARAGVVEWFQASLRATYNPNLATSPSNMPFANGSPQNWGNALRIRHDGDFTSWYLHLQANGVLVNVGDVVTQGQAVAVSGDTGRSSGPHLHFHVQADSIDWGQSVPHTFGAACKQPAAGTSVTP